MIKKFGIIVLVVFASCEKKAPVEKAPIKNSSVKQTAIVQKSSEKKITLQDKFKIDFTLVDNEFASSPFGFEGTAYSTLKRLKPNEIQVKAIVNDYVENQIDTLYTFYFDKSNVKVYKLPDRQYIVSSIIRDSIISLKDNITVGMSKKSFISKFKGLGEAKRSDNTFRIEIFENEQWVDFEFIDDKLAQAIFTGYID